MTLPFTGWARDNKSSLMDEQVQAGYAWLCGEMVDQPDLRTFEDCVEDGYRRNAWYDHNGKRGGKEAFNAYWAETKSGYLLLRVTYNDFSAGKESWTGYETVSRLYEEAKSGVRWERPKVDPARQQEGQVRLEARRAKQQAEEEDVQRAYEKAKARYGRLPEATTWGKYFQDKGFKGTPTIPGLKRFNRKGGGGYDVAPIISLETGEITSFEYYFDVPFQIKNSDGKEVMVRKIYQRGGSVKGSAIFLDPFPGKGFSGEFRQGEGVATLLTVSQAGNSEKVCHVAALSANNLAPVYNALAQRWPKVAKAGRIRLVLDNDWQKALEVNPDTGGLKPNTGLVKGHQLAMRHMTRVYQPDFTAFANAEGSLSDFNDLARVAGLDEVKRQLVLKDPDQDFAFAGAVEKEHARKLALYRNHDVTVLNADEARYFSPDHIKKGRVNILLGVPDTGKSTATKAFHDAHPDQSRLTIVPLAALAENKAEELGDACYSAPEFRDKRLLRQQDHLVTCVDSLIHLVPDEQLDPDDPDEMRLYNSVVLEEFGHTCGRQVREMQQKVLVRGSQKAQIQGANTVIAGDADCDEPELRQLERLRPGERFNVVILTHTNPLDVYFYASPNDHQAATLEALMAGEKVAHPCTKKTAATGGHLLAKDRLGDALKSLLVTADNDGDPEVTAFNRNPDAMVENLDYVPYSPKWDTGISVKRGHGFTRVFGEVSASMDSPSRAFQRNSRFRGIRRWDVYVEPGVTFHETDRQKIAARWGGALGDWDQELLGMTADYRRGIADPDYEQLVLDKIQQEHYATANVRLNLMRLCHLRGARLHFVWPSDEASSTDNAATDLVAERKLLDRDAEAKRLLDAEAITDTQAAWLERDRRTSEESAKLAAFEVRRTRGMARDAPLEREHIDECRGGTLERQLFNLELTSTNQEGLRELHRRQHKVAEKHRPDTKYYGVIQWANRTALEAYNVNPVRLILTSRRPVTKDSYSIKRAIRALIDRRDELNAAGFNLPDPDEMRENPMTTLGNLLRRVGMKTRAIRNEAGRPRLVNEERLAYLAGLVEARREREAERSSGKVVEQFETGYAYREDKTAACLNSPDESNAHLPRAFHLPLGYDAPRYLERVLESLEAEAEAIEPTALRELALVELAQTASEAEQGELYERYHARRLLDGRLVPAADDPERTDDLTCDALAVLGWARTRALLNRHKWDAEKPNLKTRFAWGRSEWSGFAKRAVEAWRQPPTLSPSETRGQA